MSDQDNKLGLCLSGGGFRAALFHIGTLAALAERELLHKVEVLSTVSGGSIIGAYYYLKVKQLLEGNRPGCPIPTPSEYVKIIKEIERDFLTAVQENIRMRLFLNPYKTAKMILEEEYSRSDRLSELLNEYFYNHLSLVDGIRLRDIHINPRNAKLHLNKSGEFSVQNFNEIEQCKIPVLTINATCLNTGHPWHFTGSWMGEPQRDGMYKLEENSNCILPQLRFDGNYNDNSERTVDSWQIATMNKIMLSDAVAASAAVPGVFPPLPVHGLYRNSGGDEIVVELSDGGVFDNQGLDALLAAHCTHIFVSDASGQLEDELLLPTDLVTVAQRANDVMMERIRGLGYFDIGFQVEAKEGNLKTDRFLITERAFTHLRELAPNKKTLPALPGPVDRPGGVVYRLSGVRTDLDSFSDMEASTLMYQGYSLALDKLSIFGMGNAPSTTLLNQWRFMEIRDVIIGDLSRLTKHLSIGKQQFFKTFRLAPLESWSWLLFLFAPFILIIGFWLYANWDAAIIQPQLNIIWGNNDCCAGAPFSGVLPHPIPPTCKVVPHCLTSPTINLPQPPITWGDLIVYTATALFTLLPVSPRVRELFKTLPWLRRLKQNPVTDFGSKIIGIVVMALAVFASLAVFLQLKIFNPIFLKAGRLKLR